MRKISITTGMAACLASFLLGAGIFGSQIYFAAPEPVQPAMLPVLNFSNTKLDTGSITGASPFRGFALPDMPELPDVPDMPENNKLTVIGVLPPDVVILRKGGETLTAKSGSVTKWGTVNYISSAGADIDGTFLNLK